MSELPLCLMEIEKFLSQNQFELEEFLIYTRSFFKNLIEYKIQNKNVDINCIDLLQIIASTYFSNFLLKFGAYSLQKIFIITSLTNSIIETETQFFDFDLKLAQKRIDALKRYDIKIYYQWCQTLFYFGVYNGTFLDLSKQIFDEFLENSLGYDFSKYNEVINREYVILLGQLISWGELSQKDTSQFTKILLKLVDDQQYSIVKIEAAQLIVLNRSIELDRKAEIAKELLNKHEIHPLKGLELNIVISQYDLLQDQYSSKNIYKAISILKKVLKSRVRDQLIQKYEMIRISRNIHSLIYSLLKKEMYFEAMKIINYFFSEKSDILSTTFLYLPNIPEGNLCAVNGTIKIIPRISEVDIKNLVQAMNDYFNLNYNVEDVEPLPISIKEKIGKPNERNANKFITAHKNVFRFSLAIDLVNNSTCMKLPNCGFFPHQALMIKEISKTLPINSSSRKPLIDRSINQILFWADIKNGPFTSEIELNTLIELCKKNGISYKVFNEDLSITRFRKEFLSNKYDIFWVSAHSKFDMELEHRSKLQIVGEDYLHLKDMFSLSNKLNTDKRRLLFLNSCESATSSIVDSFCPIGIGPNLSRRNQAVIAHLWSVHIMAALCTGVLYFINLLKEKLFFSAYEETIKDLLRGNDYIVKKMTNELGKEHEIVQRIHANTSIRYDELNNFGTLAFYE